MIATDVRIRQLGDAGGLAYRPGTLPDGLRVYVVGDIHGRLDLLRDLYAKIAGDLAAGRPRLSIEVFLGDYVDRGTQSRQVIEWLTSTVPLADQRVCLMGNHEQMLLAACSDPFAVENWLMNGGVNTMRSYGADPLLAAGPTARSIQLAFRSAFPERHQEFVAGLPRLAVCGGYVFVHAGLRPGRALDQQDPEDLLWIREPFLSSGYFFDGVVVHGHTPVTEPENRANRINLDTGAVFTGRLTCAVLEGQARRFLQTGS